MLFCGLFLKSRFKSLCSLEWQSSKVHGCKDRILSIPSSSINHPLVQNIKVRRHYVTNIRPKCFKRYCLGKERNPKVKVGKGVQTEITAQTQAYLKVRKFLCYRSPVIPDSSKSSKIKSKLCTGQTVIGFKEKSLFHSWMSKESVRVQKAAVLISVYS